MRALLSRSLALPLAAAAVLAAGSARAELYPTDQCVARKLAAAADACRETFDAYALRVWFPRASLLQNRLDAIGQKLEAAFTGADAESAAAGVDCTQTTVSGDAMRDVIREGASEIDATLAPLGPQGLLGGLLRSRRLQAAGLGCDGLVDAESTHLERRAEDTDRAGYEHDRSRALDLFRRVYRLFAWPRWLAVNGLGEVEGRLVALSQKIVLGGIVSPNVDAEWTMVTPDAQVAYLGQTLEPLCSKGTPWVYFVKRGTVNKLLVYYQGGGACWDWLTCAFLPVYKQSTGPGDDPAGFQTGFADLSNPENPFRDWNAVFVPYCTGDVHWGDADYVHVGPRGQKATIHHRGRVNAAVAEKFAREHFVDPEQVFVTGSSAGAYGAILNGVYLQHGPYPSSDFAILGDAGNGVITQDFLLNDLSKWGIANTLPAWIPDLAKPLAELDASQVWSAAARFYPTRRYATYTSAYDGGTGGQTGFYQVMRNPDNPLLWTRWWDSTCDWHDRMRELSLAAALAAPNYRYYIGTGSRHTMWGSNKVYTDTTGGVPKLVDWVAAMRDGTPAWTDVECQDCGVLLPGDPRPAPAEYPFTDDGRIDCSVPPPPPPAE